MTIPKREIEIDNDYIQASPPQNENNQSVEKKSEKSWEVVQSPNGISEKQDDLKSPVKETGVEYDGDEEGNKPSIKLGQYQQTEEKKREE